MAKKVMKSLGDCKTSFQIRCILDFSEKFPYFNIYRNAETILEFIQINLLIPLLRKEII